MNDVCNAPGLLSIETAISNMLDAISFNKHAETIPVMSSVGRILATDVLRWTAMHCVLATA